MLSVKYNGQLAQRYCLAPPPQRFQPLEWGGSVSLLWSSGAMLLATRTPLCRQIMFLSGVAGSHPVPQACLFMRSISTQQNNCCRKKRNLHASNKEGQALLTMKNFLFKALSLIIDIVPARKQALVSQCTTLCETTKPAQLLARA